MEAEAWSARAEDLARWAWNRLINRTDVWGKYGEDGTYTAPSVRRRGQVYLGLDTVGRHFRATSRDDILGSHSTSPDNLCKWIAADIDRHGEVGNDPASTLAAAMAWHERARAHRFRPILSSSNGAGGYHLRVLFRIPIPAPKAFAFARWLCHDHAQHGLPAVETFPKQAQVGKCGNWLRLPGRHYKRDYWSQIWDGSNWLDGREAIGFILTHDGDDPALLPELPPQTRPAPRRVYNPGKTTGGSLAARAAAYVAKLPRLGEGQGRSTVAFGLASFLARDLALADSVVLEWLTLWDSGNNPPLGPEALQDVLACAHRHGSGAVGSGLEPARPHRDSHGHVIITVSREVY